MFSVKVLGLISRKRFATEVSRPLIRSDVWCILVIGLKKKQQFIYSVNGDESKTARIIKTILFTSITSPNVNVMLSNITFYDICYFLSVAVNIIDELLLFTARRHVCVRVCVCVCVCVCVSCGPSALADIISLHLYLWFLLPISVFFHFAFSGNLEGHMVIFNFQNGCLSPFWIFKTLKFYWLMKSGGLRCVTMPNLIKIAEKFLRYLGFWPTVLSVEPLVHCVVCLSSSVVCLWRFVLWRNGAS